MKGEGMKERKVLILDTKMCEPIRKKGGGWTTVTHEFREVVEDLGRPYVLCNICKEEDYPDCQKYCEMEHSCNSEITSIE